MKFVWVLILSQILLLSLGGCASEPKAEKEEKPGSHEFDPNFGFDPDSRPYSWEDTMILLNELKDIVLAQEGLYNICLEEDGTVTVEPREDIDLHVELDTERIRKMMEELEIDIIYVRPQEEYFGYVAGVEIYITWPYEITTELCYSTTGAPGYLFEDYPEWRDLGGDWYMAHMGMV